MRTYISVMSLILSGGFLMGCVEQEAAPAQAQAEPFEPEIVELIDEYESVATTLSVQLADNPKALRHDHLIERLLTLTERITPAFVRRHPECKAYLEAAQRIRHLWYTLEPAQIERDYHDDEGLPAEGISPACYHMKDLIVHPASAAALLMLDPPDHGQAKREIDEVLAHVGVVRRG